MVGLYGQVLPVTGWTATVFESIGDDDPADHEIRIPVFEGQSLDPDLFEHDYFSPSIYVPGDDELVYLGDGRFSGIKREFLYE